MDDLSHGSHEAAPVRLRDGHHLYQGRDGDWRLACPEDHFVRLRVAAELGAVLAGLVNGEYGVAAALTASADPERLSMVVDRLAQAGLLVPVPTPPAPAPFAGRRVVVQGTNPVALHLAGLLRGSGAGVVSVDDGIAPPEGADLLVACAGWLPDARWRGLDGWCQRRRIPWHRCHAEGARFFLGPLTVPGSTAGYLDTRARRLAAATLPDELEAYWACLDTGERIPPVIWPNLGTVAVLAGLLAADTLAVLAGEPVPSDGCQLEVDPFWLTVRRHPVLPLPAEVMIDAGS